MTRAVLALLTLAAATVAPSVAEAHDPPDLRYLGGCGFDTVSQREVTGEGRYVGAMFGQVVAYSPRLAHNPVTVTSLRCDLRINGVTVESTDTVSGTGPVAVVRPRQVDVMVGDTDHAELCTVLALVDGHGVPRGLEGCRDGGDTMPPQWTLDLLADAELALDDLGVPVDDVWAAFDAAWCAALECGAE